MEYLINIRFDKLMDQLKIISFIENFDNRPSNNNFSLCDELHFWLKENNVEYSLKWIKGPDEDFLENKSNWYIVFYQNIDAILFKLTWS